MKHQVHLCNPSKNKVTRQDILFFATCIEKWTKLKRVTARILSWKNPSIEREEVRELTADDLERAEEKWLKLVQLQHFEEEYKMLLKGKPVSAKSRIVHLDPVLKIELMRVGGRLHNAQIPEDAKHQIILPHKDEIVSKLILDVHARNGHAGPDTTLFILRERYWITQGRREVKRVLRKSCLLCKHQATRPQGQKMGSLPAERVRTWTHAGFVDVGIDFIGPVYVKDGKKTKKTWICIFVCGNTRAVHFELTLDMTTKTFLDAYRRRRGISSTIHSDNQTSFHKANKVLTAAYNDAQKVWKKIDRKEVQRTFATMGIKWKFITERASHQGGWWERYCRMLKRPLKVVLGRALLTFQELETVLTDIEAQVNSRPITYVGDDVRDGMHLTPAHLLIGRPLGQLPIISNQREAELKLQKRFLYRQRVADHFWQRWTKEYLPNLNVRRKWHEEKKPLRVGDVVLVAEDKTPRGKWILAKKAEMYTGRDGLIPFITFIHVFHPTEFTYYSTRTYK